MTIGFSCKSTSLKDLTAVFESTSKANFLASFAFPLVAAFSINDIVVPRKNEPLVCMRERKEMMRTLARVCRFETVVLFAKFA